MSRYRGDPRYSAGDLAYRDAPTQRWDNDRFARERDYRGPPPFVERPTYDDYRPAPRPSAPVYEREREYYEDDRYGPQGQRSERRFYEEDETYRDPRAARGAMVPFRPERPSRPQPPVRPGQMIRRQSSLDTFDRRPSKRYDDPYDGYRGPPIGRPNRPQFEQQYYDEVKVQDPDRYGDDGFREYREREWVRRRRRSNSSSRSRSRDRRPDFVEEVKEEKIVEKSYPRKGKTRMPRRLVHTKVLYELGYPFYEEDEKTILIEKALGPENIDQVFTMSKEYRERETSTTRLLEAPPPIIEVPPPRSAFEEKIIERESSKTIPMSQAARSVQDWDGLSVRSPSPKSTRHRSRSRRRSRRGSSPGTIIKETVLEKKIIEREVSPARTNRTSVRDLSPTHTHRTRRRSHGSFSDDETVIEKTKIITDEEAGESNSVHVGPLALVVDRHPSRTDRDIKEEIRRLETERRHLRRDRRYERDSDEVVKIERIRDRSPSPRGEIAVIDRRGDEIVEVKKDRRASRARSRSVAPSAQTIKALMYTLT